MCRMVIFGGTCTRCGEAQTWDYLSQELSCLEAKNRGGFGECSGGVFAEQHEFDQECDRCSEEDEGVGDVDDCYFDDEEEQAEEHMTALGKQLAEEEEEEKEEEKKGASRRDRKKMKT